MKEISSPPVSGEPTPAVLRLFVNLGHLTLGSIVALGIVMFLWKGDPYDQTWQIFLLTTFFGRAASVGAGLSMDFSPVFLFYVTTATDILLVLYIFPVFAVGYRHLAQVRYIGGYLENLHGIALNYKDRVAKYGVMGLMIFVIFPFWSTGPLVASIIGYLIGMPALTTLFSVSAANVVAVAAWVWFYDWLQDWNAGVAMALLVIIFALAFGGIAAGRIRRAKKEKS